MHSMSALPEYVRRFAVRSVFWRQCLDFALRDIPFYLQPILIWVMTGFFFFFAAPARRAIVSNLAIVLPGSSRFMNHLRAFRTLLNFAWTITESAHYKLNRKDFAYEIVGAEFLEQLGAANGAIVLTAHMGSYDLGAALFAQKFNRPLRMVRAPEPDRRSEQHLRESVQQAGEGAIKIDYNNEGALLSFDLLSALRKGEIVSIQGDRVLPGVAEAKGRLFGHEALLPMGPFTLAFVAQVPIYPLFIARAGYRRYRVIVGEPIIVSRTSRARDEDTAVAVAAWCRVLEQTIARYWDQWFALTPIFVTNAKP
jgi:lauroyl/myristoyl acyltransferase